MNLSNYKPYYLVSFVVLIWAPSNWMLSHLWDYDLAQGLGPIAVVIAVLLAYDKWLWKLPVFNLMIKVPDLNGRYSGRVSYKFDGQNSSKSCEFVIQQTASDIKVTGTFNKGAKDETSSESKEALFTRDEVGNYSLLFYYQNEGSSKGCDSLNQHDGLTKLKIGIDESNKVVLDGYYFTNRSPQTKGCIKLSQLTSR